jgi:hypothetical protein
MNQLEDLKRLWRHPRGREALILVLVLAALFFAVLVRLDWIGVF